VSRFNAEITDRAISVVGQGRRFSQQQ
jgi:hypothetical protein